MKSKTIELVGIILGLLFCCCFVTGCWTGVASRMPPDALLMDGKLVYVERVDRIPKEVLLVSSQYKTESIPPAVIGELVSSVVKTVPSITTGYNTERMNNALISRRILLRGYDGYELTAAWRACTNMLQSAIWQ